MIARYHAKYSSFGSYVPKKVLNNFDLEKIVDTSDQWIRERTGMFERHIAAEDEAASDLAYNASVKAIEASPLKYRDIDLIIVATVTGDHAFPSTACILQKKLGLKGFPAFDVSAGCTGFIYATEIARQFVENGSATNALVVGVDILTRITNWKDRNTCVLFGDGAGAAIISRADSTDISRIIDAELSADGSNGDFLIQQAGGSRHPASEKTVAENQHTIYMEGNKIFKLAVKSMQAACESALKRNNVGFKDIDWLIPHQANMRIIQALGEKLKIPTSKVIVNIEKYANTSAATIPIAIDEAFRNKKIRKGDIILLVSFGAGLTSGAVLARV